MTVSVMYGFSVNWEFVVPKNRVTGAISPFADTGIRPAAQFQSSVLKTHGVVLDAADQGRMMRIRRRSTDFILIRED